MTKNPMAESQLHLLGHGAVEDYSATTLSRSGRSPSSEELSAFDEFAGVRIGELPDVQGVVQAQRLAPAFFAQQGYTEYEATILRPNRAAIRETAIRSGSTLVDLLAAETSFWDQALSEAAERPWSDDAEALVSIQLTNLRLPEKPFLIGVMRRLRGGKQEERPLTLASGFLLLSSFASSTVRKALAGIDLRKTCDAGCSFGGLIVPRAASYARDHIYAA